ncbi:acetyl-CoA acetyltransferase [bacterium]|nr:acetyl-CoA acetyltransferase [bacterium]
MGSIKDRVAIIGMGCTKFGERWDKSLDDLMVDSATEAIADAGIKTDDIQAAWLGLLYSIGSARGTLLSQALKLKYIPITRVENACCTATDAFRNACFSVAAGIYDMVLVAGAEKMKDSGLSGLPVSYAPYWGSRVEPPVPAPTQFALAATKYFQHFGLSYEEGKETIGKIAVKNHYNGSLSPKAHFQKEVTLDRVISAPMIAYPLGLFDCCGVSDGAAAAIITRPEIAKNYRDDYILVKGLGLTCGAKQAVLNDDYDMVHFEETVTAAKDAYQDAGIENPREEIDLAVVHDCFTITELITYEDLGFSPKGKAKEDIDANFFTLQGGLPVNTDGGLKCFGHPIGATGLRMIYEVYKQLQKKCGPRQVKDARIGLTHNLGGYPGSFTSAVSIFGNREA